MDSFSRNLGEVRDNLVDIPLGRPEFGDSRYQPHDLDRSNFREITLAESGRKLSFVDGGNTGIIRAPNIAVDFTRLYFNIFRDDKRINPRIIPQRLGFYTVAYAASENGHIRYRTKLVPARGEWERLRPEAGLMEFDSFDRSMMTGQSRAPISRAAESARVFGEWKLAGMVMEKELDEGDILVRDGSLQTRITNESRFSAEATERAMQSGVILTGLSKSCSLLTSTGIPLVSAVSRLAGNHIRGPWAYHPVASISHPDHPAEMMFVKLHENSGYAFRFEFLKHQFKKIPRQELMEVLYCLARNSRDPLFPGYPYGLYDADQQGKVAEDEKGAHLMRFAQAAHEAGIWERVSEYVKASDAHDRISEIGRF